MAGDAGDDSLYPIAVLIDELRNEDVQVSDYDNDHNCHSLVMISRDFHLILVEVSLFF